MGYGGNRRWLPHRAPLGFFAEFGQPGRAPGKLAAMKPLASGPADHRALEEYIDEGARMLIREHVDPWLHFGSVGVKLRMLDGTPIVYSGIEFSGSAADTFWSRRFIDEYLRAFVDTFVAETARTARTLGQDVGVVLNDISGMLDTAVGRVLDRMAVVDQRLRGKGFPDTVKRRSVDDRRQELRSYIARRLKVEHATELLHARTILIQGAARASALVDSFSSWLLAGYAAFVALLVSNADSLAFLVQPKALTYCLYGLAIAAGLGLVQKAMAAMVASRGAGEAVGRDLAERGPAVSGMSVVVGEIMRATLPAMKPYMRRQFGRTAEGDLAADGRAAYRLAQWQVVVVALQTLLAIALVAWMAWGLGPRNPPQLLTLGGQIQPKHWPQPNNKRRLWLHHHQQRRSRLNDLPPRNPEATEGAT